MGQPIQMLTVRETARALGLREDRTYDLVRAGVLPSVKFGRQIRVELSILKAWILAGGSGLQRQGLPAQARRG